MIINYLFVASKGDIPVSPQEFETPFKVKPRVWGSLFRSQLGKSAGRNKPADSFLIPEKRAPYPSRRKYF